MRVRESTERVAKAALLRKGSYERVLRPRRCAVYEAVRVMSAWLILVLQLAYAAASGFVFSANTHGHTTGHVRPNMKHAFTGGTLALPSPCLNLAGRVRA